MPVGFGPMPSPRQDQYGSPWNDPMARIKSVACSFLTDSKRLEALLPPGLSLSCDPVVTVEFMFITELQWLAGRGYNTLGVRFPVTYKTDAKIYTGPFLSVLWENRADPIITGREELGFAKLFCEIPSPRYLKRSQKLEARWEGHSFLNMEVSELSSGKPNPSNDDGTLHFRYFPKVGEPGISESKGMVLTPPSPRVELISYETGTGSLSFQHSSWEQLPTLAHIVNALAELPQLEFRGSTVTELRADTSLHNHHSID